MAVTLEIRNTADLRNDPKIREPWTDNFVDWNRERDPALITEFEKILKNAENEKPLQSFLTEHPYLLALAFHPHHCWVFSHPRFGGGQHIPDFAYCDLNSLGYAWTLIELESPRMEATNKDESISKDCHHAVQQILDYRRWLRDNALAEQKKYPGISTDCDGWVIIGRRDGARTEREQERLKEFHKQRIEIASYDRLSFLANEHLTFVNNNWARAAENKKSVEAVRPKKP
jgi:Domain of unknown function (DUF4263)